MLAVLQTQPLLRMTRGPQRAENPKWRLHYTMLQGERGAPQALVTRTVSMEVQTQGCHLGRLLSEVLVFLLSKLQLSQKGLWYQNLIQIQMVKKRREDTENGHIWVCGSCVKIPYTMSDLFLIIFSLLYFQHLILTLTSWVSTLQHF